MDPITVMAGASAAYNAIKKAVSVGRELHDMGSQLSQWGSAVADMEFLSKQAEDPPWYKLGSSSLDATQIFANKKKLEAQRLELKQFISFSYGQKGWEEYLRIEAQVRKQKQKTEHRKFELQRKIIEWTVGTLAVILGLSILGAGIYFIGLQQGKW